MITKGIVEEILSDSLFRVRVPVFNKAKSSPTSTPTEDLPVGVVCAPAGVTANLRVGDIVFIGFEDNNISKPIILGYLNKTGETSSLCDMLMSVIDVSIKANLPSDTTIGSVTPFEIGCLSGSEDNLQWQINLIKQRLDNLEKEK